MQCPVRKKEYSSQEKKDPVKEKTKRSFPFKEDFVMSNQIKKFKVYTNQVPNTMESSSTSKDFLKHSRIQLSKILSKEHISLVEKMRPTSIVTYIGQKHVIGPGTVLKHLLEKREIPSMIFYGPSGCGKVKLQCYSLLLYFFSLLHLLKQILQSVYYKICWLLIKI